MSDTENLGVALVQAFGDPKAMMEYLSEDVVWSLPDSLLEVGGTKKGKPAVLELMENIFGAIYDPKSVKVTIHSALTDGDQVALRFGLSAVATFGPSYKNEYSLFAEVKSGKIVRVWEYLDTLGAQQQFT